MKFHSRVTLQIIGTLCFVGIWLFCTDPQKPDFGDPPMIGNNKAILADRPPVLNDTLILYLTLQTGAEPLTYHWYKNDTVISRASSDSLKFEPLELSDTGTYHCVVTNILGSDVSNPFKLDSINEVPVLGNNKQLIPVGVSYKDSAFSITVTVQSGTKPYSYRWYKKDTLIVSDTTDTLEFDSLTYADTGKYQCIVSNDFGSDTSKAYMLILSGFKPLIDNNKQVTPSGTPKKDSSFFMYITATGTKPLSYQWFKDTTPVITGGATNDTLKFSALKYSDTADYHCVVLNDFGSDTSKPHNLSLTNQPPDWLVDTMHITATETQLCTLNVKDSCSDPDGDSLTFKLVAGAPAGDTITGTFYRFTPGYNDAGSYVVTVQASDGKKTSDCYIKLSVLNKNRAPYFLDTLPKTLYSVAEGAKLVINFKTFDPDGDQIGYKLTQNTLPDNGPVTFNDSQFIWQSTHNDSGMYAVEICATDKIDTTRAPVSVAVGNVNLPPQIKIGSYKQGDTLRIKESDTLEFTVTATDPDTGDVAVLLSPKNKPAGSTYDTSSGNFTYTPSFSISTGLVHTLFLNVRFYATDKKPQYNTDSFYIHIQVLDSNSAPKWTVNSADLAATEGKPLNYNMNAVFSGDNEGDKVTFTKTFGTFNTDTSQWSWTPTFTSFHGKDTICVITASDNHNPPASSNLTLTVSIADSVVPVILSKPSNITYKSMKITWTQSTEPQFGAYKLYYDVSSNVTETSILAATITDIYKTTDTLDDLNENTRYYGRVFTYNTNNTKSGSNVVDSTTPILQPPVIIFTYPTITRDSCFVKEISPNITGNVFTAAAINTMSATINGVAATVNLQTNNNWIFNVSTAAKQQWIEIMIQAVDIEEKSTDTIFQMYYMPTLTPPAGLDTSNTKNRSVKLSWNPATYCTRYRLYRSLFSGGPYTCIADTAANSYTDTLLPINTQYWYKVKGYYSASGGFNMQDSTDFSSLATGKTKNWFFVYFNSNLFGKGKCVRQTADSGYIVLSGLSLLKTNSSGDTTWTRTYPVGGDLFEVEQLTDGGFITIGYTESATAGGKDVYLLKTDREGNISSGWPKKYGGLNNDEGVSIEQTSDGGFILTGFTGSFGAGNNDIYIIKTDANGEVSIGGWSKTYGGNNDDRGISIIQTSDGGYAVSGFASSFNDSSVDKVFLLKTNSVGDTTNNEGWFETYYTSSKYEVVYLFQMAHGGYVISGTISDMYLLHFVEIEALGGLIGEKTFSEIAPAPFSVDKTTNGFIITAYNWSETKLFEIDNHFNTLSLDTTTNISGFNVYGRSIQQTFEGGFVITGYIQNESETKFFLIKTDENGYFEY